MGCLVHDRLTKTAKRECISTSVSGINIYEGFSQLYVGKTRL